MARRSAVLSAGAAYGLLLALLACGGNDGAPAPTERATPAESPVEEEERPPFEQLWPALAEPWMGDLDGMLERHEIRVLTAYTLGSYFIDRGEQRGGVYEATRLMEKFARKRLGKPARHLKITILPVRRDQILPYLVDGYGDIAFANLTVTPERQRLVDFSSPFTEGARELLVTGPDSPEIRSLDDLSGHEVTVRRDSSYFESLRALNERFDAEGRDPIDIVEADPRLEDHDILAMLDAGLGPMTVVDDHKLELWSQVFEHIRVHEDVAVGEGRAIALAIRKQSPRLRELVDAFVAKHKRGTLIGNVLVNRYTNDAELARRALDAGPFGQLEGLVELFRTYGEQYDLDWLLLASFAYQESRFDPKARSQAGAVGIMQVLPSTAKGLGIQDFHTPENNIHAGAKYLSVLRDRYFSDPDLDPFERTLFTMAAYNAGPTRIRRLREVAAERGLDPDRWFRNVELVVAAQVSREPVRYVSNIYRYYVAYRRAFAELEERRNAVGH